MGVFAKISKVIEKTRAVTKEGRNESQRYDYVRWKETAEMVRKAAVEAGLAMSTTVTEEKHEFVSENGKNVLWSFVTLRLDMTDTESTSAEPDTYSVTAHGSAKDFGDKAVYKATTGALKYALRQAFLLPDTDDDPEADETVDEKPTQPVSKPVSKPAETADKPRFAAPQGKNQEPTAEPANKAAQYVPATKLHELLKLVQKLDSSLTVDQAKAKIVDEAAKHGVTNLKAMTQAQYVKVEDGLKQVTIK